MKSTWIKSRKEAPEGTHVFSPIVTLSDADTFDGVGGLLFMIDGSVELADGRIIEPTDLQDGDTRALFREATQTRHPEEYQPKRNYQTLFPNVRIIPLAHLIKTFFETREGQRCLPNTVSCSICAETMHVTKAVGPFPFDISKETYYCDHCNPNQEKK